MHPESFQAELLGECQPSPYLPLMELAALYHRQCDAFDVALCRNPEERPRDGRETALVGRNARDVFMALLPEALRLGFIRSEFHKAIREYGKEYHGNE